MVTEAMNLKAKKRTNYWSLDQMN